MSGERRDDADPDDLDGYLKERLADPEWARAFGSAETVTRVRVVLAECRSRSAKVNQITSGLRGAERTYAEGFAAGVVETLAQLEHFLDHGATTGEVLT